MFANFTFEESMPCHAILPLIHGTPDGTCWSTGSDGQPLSGHQDWALMNLRFELALLMQFFRQDWGISHFLKSVMAVIFTTAAHSSCGFAKEVTDPERLLS